MSDLSIEDQLGLEHTYACELEGLYAPIEPSGFPEPELVMLNRPLAVALGLDPEWLEAHGAAVLSGTKVVEGSRPIAQAYAGHQFGHFNPELGDGRALLIGEVVDPEGRRFDLHLKGSGITPFSRRGDGKAALDSALREYIVSEGMHALKVPTTRALAVVSTGETVMRQRISPGAVLTRVAASHLRIGTLELFAARRDKGALERLVQYALRRHYPDLAEAETPAKALLDAVARAQARLVAHWMSIGFVHGVMNTDNVTLSGETIDFGPCAFMDTFDPRTVFSQIDHQGRYAYGNQPGIGAWNLARMAEALLELLAPETEAAVELAQESLQVYRETFAGTLLARMRAKIGLSEARDGDAELIDGMQEALQEDAADFTSSFRRLSAALRDDTPPEGEALAKWSADWRARLGDADRAATAEAMDAVNPVYVPRNHKVEEALDAALSGDLGPTRTLLEVLARPFEAQLGREDYAAPAPEAFASCYSTHCNT